ncbi:MAG TPA: hypothetical protein VGM80_03435, partial [Gaiellaceae bacterium]
MANDTHASEVGNAAGAPARRSAGVGRWTSQGWLRVLWCTPLVGFAGLGLVCLIRLAAHWHPIWQGVPLTTVGLITFPLGFLIGIGVFDDWAYYVSGRPTRAEDHSGHGAQSWRDYLRPNTDHKVIGIQYI